MTIPELLKRSARDIGVYLDASLGHKLFFLGGNSNSLEPDRNDFYRVRNGGIYMLKKMKKKNS